MTELLTHIRRPGQFSKGKWPIRCDCGWNGEVDPVESATVLTGNAVEERLEALYVAHLPADEKRLYLLVDQRQQEVWSEAEQRLVMVATGNFIMPEGTPCDLASWSEEDGVRYGSYIVAETGEAGTLPIGEIRLADNRVFKMDAPA